MFKELGSMANMLKQAQQMQEKMRQVQDELKTKVVEGSAGGGMVRAKVNGQQQVVSIKIEKEIVDPEDIQMLEDLVLAAVSQGLEKAKELAREELMKLTGGLNIPGLMP